MIVIIDYGMGNLGSILNMLKKIGASAVLSDKISAIQNADKLILPGVGAFDSGMKNLQKFGYISILEEKVIKQRTPILGICLGMQLFTQKSEEGKLKGLGWINAETIKFQFDRNQGHLKIPHMGWNSIIIKKFNPLFNRVDEHARYYFVHSYYVKCNHNEDIITKTVYGFQFTSSFQKANIYGTQFHPEKSHKFGMQILKNFSERC